MLEKSSYTANDVLDLLIFLPEFASKGLLIKKLRKAVMETEEENEILTVQSDVLSE